MHFGASWSESTQPLNDILTELLNEYKDKFQVAYVDAEAVPEAALAANIEAAPTVVFYKVINLRNYFIFCLEWEVSAKI